MERNNLLLTLLFLIITISGCAGLRPQTPPLLDAEAMQIATHAHQTNKDISTSKGIGWITLSSNDTATRFRLVWAAASPNRLRASFMMSGHPVETIVGTGTSLTFVSHTGQHDEYTIYSADPDLDSYINIDIKLSDIVSMLLGHLPIREFNDAYFDPTDKSLSTIYLGSDSDAPAQRLVLNHNREVAGISYTDYSGDSFLDIKILKHAPHGSKKVPSILEIRDRNKNIMYLEIIRFIPDAEVKGSAFRLTEKRK